jgi:glyoxylase-like metal-dependent hydrolase (beta-lactamase superfamily II)
MTARVLCAILFVFACALRGGVAVAVTEAPSTVNAVYVEPSATRVLGTTEKIGELFTLNNSKPYILQRLTERTYWFQRQFYGTVFYVGDQGVLLFDALDGRGDFIRQAIAEVTKLPITALVYSHDHADHIGDAQSYVTAATTAKTNLRIIASQATVDKMAFLKSMLPKPTEVVTWPRGSFTFEALTVELYGFERAAHADDHGIWLLTSEKVAHLPDLVNSDQPPFWAFAGSENFVYYESNLEQLDALDWNFLSGGHGNVGSKADVAFYRTCLTDMKTAVGQAMMESPWGAGVDANTVNAHTAYLSSWVAAVGTKATEILRPKYGTYYGFEYATPRNCQMIAMSMFSYR